jgi:phenylacetate-CoA ligase
MTATASDRLARNPLITESGLRRLNALLQHPDAPAWNYEVGDRIVQSDLERVGEFRRELSLSSRHEPPFGLANRLRRRVPFFASRVPDGIEAGKGWESIGTMSRSDLVTSLADIVPPDEDLSRLIVYDTSGVTGHAIRVPHHPLAVAQNHALIELALEWNGASVAFSPDVVACLNVGAQVNTVVFATVFSVWNQAGFAKVNLHPRAWEPERARRFFADAKPLFLTGDPLGFAELLAWNIDASPAAMISTAVAMPPALKAQLEARFRCPIIDYYSTTETGPIAGSRPGEPGWTVLPHDIYVEVVDADGRSVPSGESGEICVSGGRNPFLPLLRYRTGDFGRLVGGDVPGHRPRLIELSARQPVAFRAADGTAVSPVDIGRVIREWVFVQHTFVQHRDGSCDLAIKPAAGFPINLSALEGRLVVLFGDGVRVRARLDSDLGSGAPGGKVEPWVRE